MPVRVARVPAAPTAKEKAEHWVTHYPYRSWCPVSVKARGERMTITDKMMRKVIGQQCHLIASYLDRTQLTLRSWFR